MCSIKFDYKNSGIRDSEIDALKDRVKDIHHKMHKKESIGSDFLGWLDYPREYDCDEFKKIKVTSKKIKGDSDVLIVIGIGGSYLGAKAVIKALGHSFSDMLKNSDEKHPHIIFAGNNISSTYISDILDAIDDKEVSLNVISKSGGTTEPAIAFRIFKDYMYKKYGEDAKDRIYITTDKTEGNLRKLSEKEGYKLFTIPSDIGGRYSVLTSVGLLPIAVGGGDLDKLMQGAKDAMNEYNNDQLLENNCYKYAALRNMLYNKGKQTEFLVTYEPRLKSISEWWKQLFGESEGKDGKGTLPVSLNYTTDLHSMGQYIQDGRRDMFETVVNIEKPRRDIEIPLYDEDIDGLNYIAGKTIDYVNKKTMEGVIEAHVDGGVPNLTISLPQINSYHLGSLIYFFEKACAMSSYLLGVNPFDQPGVEAYKTSMFKFLGKK